MGVIAIVRYNLWKLQAVNYSLQPQARLIGPISLNYAATSKYFSVQNHKELCCCAQKCAKGQQNTKYVYATVVTM